MINTSGVHPRGRAILVSPYEPELTTGVIVLPESVRDGIRTIEQRAVVVEVGPEAWKEESQPRAIPGDRVLISAFSGFMAGDRVTKDKQQYRIVNDRDIFAVIEESV